MGEKYDVAELQDCERRPGSDLNGLTDEQRQTERFVSGHSPNYKVFPVGVGKTEKKAKQNAAKSSPRYLDEKENWAAMRESVAKNTSAALNQKTKPKCGRALTDLGPANAILEKHPTTACGKAKENKPTEVSLCTAVPDECAPDKQLTPKTKLESCDGESKCVAKSGSSKYPVVQAQNPDVKHRRGAPANVENASQSSKEEVSILEESNSGSDLGVGPTLPEIIKLTCECRLIECINEGGFGRVYKAIFGPLDKIYAVKIIFCKDINKALWEAKALSALNHNNIVRFHYCWVAETGCQLDNSDDSCSTSHSGSSSNSPGKYLFIQMELCEPKTLKNLIYEWNEVSQPNSERGNKALAIALQIISAVEYIHSKMLIHRDLKPANIMFGPDGVVKIGDFGLVTEENDNDADNLIQRSKGRGTPSYMAPEQKSDMTYDRKVDVFSLGLIFFELFWEIKTVHEKDDNWDDIRKQAFPAEFSSTFPEEYIIIKAMLSMKPEDRPEASKIKSDLEQCVQRINARALQ